LCAECLAVCDCVGVLALECSESKC
jgi:hypothetical protein